MTIIFKDVQVQSLCLLLFVPVMGIIFRQFTDAIRHL